MRSLTDNQFVHGLSVPLGKLGFAIPRTLSRARADASEPQLPFQRPGSSRSFVVSSPRQVVRLGRPIVASGGSRASSRAHSNVRSPPPEKVTADALDEPFMLQSTDEAPGTSPHDRPDAPPRSTASEPNIRNRMIQFPDEVHDREQADLPMAHLPPLKPLDQALAKDNDMP